MQSSNGTHRPAHRVLIIGVGSIGTRHARCFASTGRARLGLCDTQRDNLDVASNLDAIDGTFLSLDQALDDQTWDAAVIATPAHTHIQIASQLAQRNVPMLIEKPLSASWDGVGAFAQEIQDRDLFAAVAYTFRGHTALIAMKNALAEGRFGKPRQLIINAGQHFPTYRPAYRDIYYAQHKHGGGAIQDALSHLIDAGQWLVGPIDRFFLDADHLALQGVDVEDTVHMIARHGPVMASYSLNQHQQPKELSITVVAEQATCRFEAHPARWGWMSSPGGEWHYETASDDPDTAFINQANALLDALEGKPTQLCTLDEAIQCLAVQLQALQNVQQPAWTTVDAQHRTTSAQDTPHASP